MTPSTLSKSLNYLLIYFVVLFLLKGMFGNDLVDDLVHIAILYGIPLFIFIIIYLVTMAFELHAYIKSKNINVGILSIVSIKMGLSIVPMLYLDNTLVSLLSKLRIS